MQKMKEYGLEFDNVVYLTDTSEEEPGKEIKKRMQGQSVTQFDYEEENSRA
jgi:hypothetical protein